MNGHHFRTFLWLRWRIRVNQMRRGGIANAVLLALLALLVGGLVVVLFAGSLLLGIFAMPEASPLITLYVWDGLVAAFLFLWLIGLMVDLQRSDPLTLDKILHLPVSLTGAFLVNYLSSLINVVLLLTLATMLGLGLGSAFSCGPALLVVFPLVAAFVLAATALTYQFQGWLASLMANPRRRRTVIVLVTVFILLLSQLPQLFNLIHLSGSRSAQTEVAAFVQEQAALLEALKAGKITFEEYQRRFADLERDHQAGTEEASRHGQESLERMTRLLNVALPPGWLPTGVASAREGQFLPAVLGTLGLTLIGAASLWRAYRTTVRIYTGQLTSGTPKRAPAAKGAGKTGSLLEWRLPWLSEQSSAIALGAFTSLVRAPEAKIMLLTPLIFGVVFGSMLLSGLSDPPAPVRPLIAFGATAMVYLAMLQLAGNMFGFDRGGFRVLVLCPAPRRGILLGKNLALAPFLVAWGILYLAVVQFVYPMRFDHFLAAVPQMLSMYLLYCLVGNWLSIFAPVPIAQGSFKTSRPGLVPALLHMLAFFLFPLLFSPLLAPLGVELAVQELGGVRGAPICLLLSVLLTGLIVLLYLVVLPWQGRVLQAREQQILKVVTSKE